MELCTELSQFPSPNQPEVIQFLEEQTEREREREQIFMEDGDGDKALRKIGEAFKEIASAVNSQTVDIEVAPFSHACSLVSPLFGCLGIAFKFAEMDYVAKVPNSF